jgi:nucleoside-diphosphate-sugar epimerase
MNDGSSIGSVQIIKLNFHIIISYTTPFIFLISCPYSSTVRVFVTGASGFIGSAVVPELLKAGHKVLALARSDKSAASLSTAGTEVHRGDLEDLECLKSGASQCDGVIHLAMIMDFSDYEGINRKDRAAIRAIGEALAGSNKPFVVTSGILLLKPGDFRTEDDDADLTSMGAARAASEGIALGLASRGVRVSIIQLAPTVHGDGDKGFIPMFIEMARKSGEAWYIGDGGNRWTAVHRLDAATLYRLALEKGKAGSKFHGVQDECVYLRDIIAVVGRKLNIPVVSKTLDEATKAVGHFLAHVNAADGPAYSKITTEKLGWTPKERGLLEDMELGSYF